MRLRRRIGLEGAWLSLVALTIASVLIAERAGSAVLAGVIASWLAAVKGSVIVARFMEIGREHRPWSWLLYGWVAVVAVMFTVAAIL